MGTSRPQRPIAAEGQPGPGGDPGRYAGAPGLLTLDAASAHAIAVRAASRLAARGVRSGDRVVLCVSGGPQVQADYLGVVLGATRSGVVPVPLDPSLTPPERARLVADADPRLVVDSPAQLAELTAGPGGDDVLHVGGDSGADVLAPVPLVRPMHYTSGTTGTPKGVWSGVLDLPAASALAAEERECWHLGPQDRHLVVAPLHHSAPLRFATATLLAGGAVVLAGRFDPERTAAAIAAARPTTTFMAPVHLRRLLMALGVLAAGGGTLAGGDLPTAPGGSPVPLLSGFRLVAHAGAPCPPAVKRAALAAFPSGSVWEFYGSTEGQVTVCSPDEWVARPGTVGRARPGRRVHLDPDGMIWCEVPDYARFSYWRDDAKTAAAWRGRSFTVGDLGRLDADGYLWLEGRRTDLIISGGVNVYPLEVEQVLNDCPGVDEVAVYGMPDEEWGQRVEAAVVGDVTVDAVHEWARAHLAPAKRPKRVHLVDALPRTPSGKLRRRDLRAWSEAGG